LEESNTKLNNTERIYSKYKREKIISFYSKMTNTKLENIFNNQLIYSKILENFDLIAIIQLIILCLRCANEKDQ